MTVKEARVQLALGTATPWILLWVIVGIPVSIAERGKALKQLIGCLKSRAK